MGWCVGLQGIHRRQLRFESTAIRAGDELADHFGTDTVQWLEREGLMVKVDLVRRVVDSIKMFHAGLAEEDA